MKNNMILYAIVILVILVIVVLAWSFLTTAGEFKATPFDFRLTANPSSGAVTQGQITSSTITATLLKAKAQYVQLSVSSCPSSATCILNPSGGYPTFNSQLTITTSTLTPTGNYYVNVNGVGGGKTRSTTYTLTVNPVPCSCSGWTNGACGADGCIATERYQTRTCTPSGCDVQSRCVADVTCTNPDSCSDSDGGLVWNVKGTVSGYKNNNPYNYTDYCLLNRTIIEYYCAGTASLNTNYTCSVYCYDGACY